MAEFKNVKEWLPKLRSKRVSERCKLLNKYISSILTHREALHQFFCHLPALVVEVFGLKSGKATDSWVDEASRPSDQQELIKFLSPTAPLFKAMVMSSVTHKIGNEMLFPTTRLPGPTQQVLSSLREEDVNAMALPVLYRGHKRLTGHIVLSVLEYYFFCYAYFLTTASNDVVSSVQTRSMFGMAFASKKVSSKSVRHSVFKALTDAYIASFIYVESPRPAAALPSTMGSEYTLSSVLSSLLPANVASPSSSRLGYAGGEGAGSSADLLGMGAASPAAIVRGTSDMVLRVFVEFWLCQNAYTSSGVSYTIPSVESLFALKRLVAHLCADVELGRCLGVHAGAGLARTGSGFMSGSGGGSGAWGSSGAGSSVYGGSGAGSGFGLGRDAHAASLLRGTVRLSNSVLIVQKPLYHFLRLGVARISFDGAVSLRDMVGVWLAYVAPWQYWKDTASEAGNPASWQPFILHNLLFYTTLFRDILEAACALPFSTVAKKRSDSAILLLHDILDVFDDDVVDMVMALELTAFDPTIRDHNLSMEGLSYKHEPLFAPTQRTCGLVQRLVVTLRTARGMIKASSGSGGSRVGSTGSSTLSGGGASSSGKGSSRTGSKAKALQRLGAAEDKLLRIFRFRELQHLRTAEEPMTPDLRAMSRLSAESLHIESPVLAERMRLTPAGRRQVSRGSHKFSPLDEVPVFGDPASLRIGTNEFAPLVQVLFTLSSRLNEAYGLPRPRATLSQPLLRAALALDEGGHALFGTHFGDNGVVAVDDPTCAVVSSNPGDALVRFRLRWIGAKPLWVTLLGVCFAMYLIVWLLG